jgi:hypothetical protein
MPIDIEERDVVAALYFNTKNGGFGGALRGSWASLADGPYEGTSDFMARLRFEHLARIWKRATRYESSLTKIVTHHAYQAIIGMGPSAIPMILADLRTAGGHWFWALHAISQADPEREGDDYESVRAAWLRWGVANGYL